jgi:acetyl-CoA acyltransferase
VAIVAGARTPFAKAGKAFAGLGPLALAKHAVQGLLKRHDVDPGLIEAITYGVVVAEPGKPNWRGRSCSRQGCLLISRGRR